MAYNTRRSGDNMNNLPSIGQRRPQPAALSNNFVQGRQQLIQNKPGVQQAPPQQQQQHPPQIRPPHQPPSLVRNPIQAQQMKEGPPPAQNKPQAKPLISQQQPAPVAAVPPAQILESDEDTPKKKLWFTKMNKISKKEKQKRRNARLSKILLPKNGVMILNELVKNVTYAVEDVALDPSVQPHYKATAHVDGAVYSGFGRNKISAKNAAAETALKFLIKSKRFSPDVKVEDEEAMKVDSDGEESVLPWQHVASFALYKLFSMWGEDPNQQTFGQDGTEAGKPAENRPSKKMPANPESMNPLMLVNQMLPQAKYEEIGRSGTAPNFMFSYRCIVDGQSFVGTGPNKKAARKQAAYDVCKKLLNVVYPPEEMETTQV